MYKAIKSNGDIRKVRHKDETIWKLDTKPRVFIFGNLSGIVADDLEACIKTTEYEIVGKMDAELPVLGNVDFNDQTAVLETYKKNNNIIIVLGFLDESDCSIYAETFKDGDPTYAGPLAGLSLNLKTYHITEPEIKNKCDPKAYKDHAGIIETVINVEEIHKVLKAMRDS